MLTRAAIESEVLDLVARLMALVGIAGAEADGYHRYLNAPIRDGLREMGYPVADPIEVADSDLAGLDGFAVRRLVEWSELRVLEQVARDWWRLLERPPAGLTPEALDRMEARVARRIEELKAVVKRPFNPFVLPLAVGSVSGGSGPAPAVPPWDLGCRSRWYYGVDPSAYWGWGDC